MKEYGEDERCGKTRMGAETVDSGEPSRREHDLPGRDGALVSAVVVDDNPDIRALLRNHLELSHKVTVVGVAGNGVEAVSITERLQPDVILLDLGLPKLSGIDAIPLLRKLAPDTKIIAISGFVEGSQAQAARAAGVDAYVEKGLSMRLVEVIDEVVHGVHPTGD